LITRCPDRHAEPCFRFRVTSTLAANRTEAGAGDPRTTTARLAPDGLGVKPRTAAGLSFPPEPDS